MNWLKTTGSIFLSMIILAADNNQLLAQDINENNFILYTKQQGLSHTDITCLAQDSIGYIWVSTASGLNRFNGNNFVQFHSGNDSLSLPQENLAGLVWLDKHRLAAYTSEGLHIVDTRTSQTRNLFVPYANQQFQYKFNGIVCANGTPAGDIFLLTRSGFYHYDKDYQLVFRFDFYPKEKVASAHFVFGRKLLWLNNGQLAVVSSNGMYSYTIAKMEFKKMNAIDWPLLKEFLDNYPMSDCQVFQPSRGGFFIMNPEGDSLVYYDVLKNRRTVTHLPFARTRGEFDYRTEMITINDTLQFITGNLSGFYKLKINGESGQVTFEPKKYFPSYYCRDMLEDRDHNLWIATNKGLLRQDINQMRSIQRAIVPGTLQDSLPNMAIDDIYVAGDSLYAATRGGGGLLVFDKRQLQFTRRISFDKSLLTYDNVFCLVGTNDNSSVLAGTSGPVMKIKNKMGSKPEIIPLSDWDNKTASWFADMCRGKDNTIWIAAADNIYKYDLLTGKSERILTYKDFFYKIQGASKIKVDADGNVWVAGHGLFRYNIKLKKIDRVVDSFPFIRIPDQQVNSFATDRQNNLWINSNNNGLICYNIDKGTFRHFTRDNGLPDNNIFAMIVIHDKLWMAGFSGISCLDLRTDMISSFGTEDGFPDLPIAKGSKFFYDSAMNKLYVGLATTVVQFDPGIIFQRSRAPHVFIESLVRGDQKCFFPGKNYSTTWRNNEVTITIGSINFFTSSSQRFAYRLIKEDSTPWQQLGTQNTFSISNLASGHHRVQVKSFSLSNRWPEQIEEIEIVVSTPLWKKTWFQALAIILLIAGVYALLKRRTSIIRRNEQAKTHMQELKAEEYKMRLELEQISHYFSSSLADKKNIDEVLWDVAKNLIGRMKYVDCMIYLWNEDKTKMVQKASFGPKGDPIAISENMFDVAPGQGVVGYVMQTKEPLIVPDTRKDDRYRVDDIMRLSELCVPIIHDNELIGIIDSEHHSENHFKERDIKILTTIATLVGNKIKQIESEKSLEIKQKEIGLINQQLAEAQLSALQTQMNPHFIFNSLNSIKGMILGNEQQKASRYLSKFAQMIRITLNQSKEIFTTLYENVEHLENYLLMEKLRFDDSFTFRITVDEQIDKEEVLIPTLMIQPLAENAIWHGLMHKKGEKKLSIRFCKMGESISCIIEDNGIGINRSEQLKQLNRSMHQSVGLSNLRNRIKIMNEKYAADCSLNITDLQDSGNGKTGTCAILRFNIIINKQLL